MNSTPDTFTIPTFQFGDFITRMDKLNRKAKRLGCSPATYQVVGVTTIKVKPPEDFLGTGDYTIPAKIVSVTGKAPQVGNHQLLARIEYLDDSKKLFHTVPGTETKVDERFRSLSAGICEHCNKIRLRRDTFVVRNTIDGDQKQVGRNCLADFIGGVSPEQIANQASYLKLFDEVGGDNDHSFRGYFRDKVDTFAVLCLTSAYINVYGWVPKSAANEQFRPTASRVAMHFISNQTHFTQEEKEDVISFGAMAKDVINTSRATDVIGWIKNDLSATAKSDYELNLCTLVVGDLTETKHLGIVCSAVSAFQRAMNQQVAYANRKSEAAKSEFIGVTGGKFKDVSASVQFVKGMSSVYGPTTLIKFVDENGNIMSWFASGDKRFEPGQKVVISGSIKGHKEYQGAKETQVTRVKVK